MMTGIVIAAFVLVILKGVKVAVRGPGLGHWGDGLRGGIGGSVQLRCANHECGQLNPVGAQFCRRCGERMR